MFPPLKQDKPTIVTSKSAFLKAESFNSSSKGQSDASSKFERKEPNSQKCRREKKESEEKLLRALMAKELYEKRKLKAAKEKDLRQQRRKLVHRLEVRPQDKKSALALIEVAYELEEYMQVCTVIKRSLARFIELRTHNVYLKLGRCYLRRWKKDGARVDLQESFDAYAQALHNPETLVRPLASPYPYLEFVGICIRLDKRQMALDTLGALIARWRDDYGLLMLCQYIVAQITFVSGNSIDANELYQQLMLCPTVLEPLIPFEEGRSDSIPMVSTFMVSVVCQIEVACLSHRFGKLKLSVRLFAEAFERQCNYGPIILSDGFVVDIRNGISDFETWASSPATYKFLADLLAVKFFNLAIAAELYGIASEVYCKNIPSISSLTKAEKSFLCGLVLDRGESLSEMCDHDNAEHCGHYAYKLLPVDAVVTGRAARCCQRNNARNNEITLRAVGVFQAVNLMSRILRKKVATRRKMARLELHRYATIISSAIRMALVRNNFAGDILEGTPTIKIAQRIQSLRGLWKSGQKELMQWVELWNISCKIIQRGLWRWFIRRKNTKVIRGITTCKRIWRGQRTRRRLRDRLSLVQDDLDSGELCGSGKYGIYFDCATIHRISAGITIITNDQNIDDKKSDVSVAVSKTPPPQRHHRRGADDSNTDYAIQLKSREIRRKPGSGDAGSSWFANSEHSDYSSPPQARSPLKSRSAPGSINLHSPSVASDSSLVSAVSFKSQTQIQRRSTSLVSIEELDKHVQISSRLGEDIITILSVKNIQDDPTYKWAPFASLPEEAIVRLLTCTVLVITSPSFSLQDCLRVKYTCSKFSHLWSNIKSLHIYGTRLGHGTGLQSLLELGLKYIHTLAFSHTGASSAFGATLGGLLTDMKEGSRPTSLTKLYIENEPRFGIQGTMHLMQSLQFNTSLRIVSIRRCKLNYKVVPIIARFVSLSTHLEILNVNDNNFKYADCRQFLHAVANKGIKGNFRGLYCIGSYPALRASELEKLFEEGVNIRVNVVSGELDSGGIGFRKELASEKEMFETQGLNIEKEKLSALNTYMDEIRRLGSIEDWERVSMHGTKAYKAIYF
jgi:hypothetical protein